MARFARPTGPALSFSGTLELVRLFEELVPRGRDAGREESDKSN